VVFLHPGFAYTERFTPMTMWYLLHLTSTTSRSRNGIAEHTGSDSKRTLFQVLYKQEFHGFFYLYYIIPQTSTTTGASPDELSMATFSFSSSVKREVYSHDTGS